VHGMCCHGGVHCCSWVQALYCCVCCQCAEAAGSPAGTFSRGAAASCSSVQRRPDTCKLQHSTKGAPQHLVISRAPQPSSPGAAHAHAILYTQQNSCNRVHKLHSYMAATHTPPFPSYPYLSMHKISATSPIMCHRCLHQHPKHHHLWYPHPPTPGAMPPHLWCSSCQLARHHLSPWQQRLHLPLPQRRVPSRLSSSSSILQRPSSTGAAGGVGGGCGGGGGGATLLGGRPLGQQLLCGDLGPGVHCSSSRAQGRIRREDSES
jgi:hypothetical protein